MNDENVTIKLYGPGIASKGGEFDIDYLNEKSIVFDLGGFEGNYTDVISEVCGSKIFLFEPVEEYFGNCHGRFKNHDNVKCYHFGLGDKNYKFDMIKAGASSRTM